MPQPPAADSGHDATTDPGITAGIRWSRLRDVPDLADYLGSEADSESFTREVREAFAAWAALPAAELEAIAQLRALEVTNGCVQWAFRRQVEGHLEVEPTRECMKTVMGFMLSKRILWPDGTVTGFSPSVIPQLDAMRGLYLRAFKQGDEAAARHFYAQSAGQFLALGRERMQRAFARVSDQFQGLFTEPFLDRGRRYAARFLIPLSPSESEEGHFKGSARDIKKRCVPGEDAPLDP
jgi:hypothetical protein